MKPTNTFVTLPKTLDEIVEQCQKRKIFKNLALQLIAKKKKELKEVTNKFNGNETINKTNT